MTLVKEGKMIKLKKYLLKCAKAYNRLGDYPFADRILAEVFSGQPENRDFSVILHKVAVLNSLCRTNIFDIYEVARHIHELKIDVLLQRHSAEAVEKLRRVRRLQRDLYSFATKYCHWHCPVAYPMYDASVSKALSYLNRNYGFHDRLSDAKFRASFEMFKGAIDALRERLSWDNGGYKKLDQGLWVFGRHLKNKLPLELASGLGPLPAGA